MSGETDTEEEIGQEAEPATGEESYLFMYFVLAMLAGAGIWGMKAGEKKKVF